MNFDPLEWTDKGALQTKRLRKLTFLFMKSFLLTSYRLHIKCSFRPRCISDFNLKTAAASVIPWPTFQRHCSSLYISKQCYLSKPRYPALEGDFGISSIATCSLFDLLSWFDRSFCWRFRALCSYETCQEEYGYTFKRIVFGGEFFYLENMNFSFLFLFFSVALI